LYIAASKTYQTHGATTRGPHNQETQEVPENASGRRTVRGWDRDELGSTAYRVWVMRASGRGWVTGAPKQRWKGIVQQDYLLMDSFETLS
jgi:hypothetical protein